MMLAPRVWILVLVLAAAGLVNLGGCAVSRADQLRAKGEQIESMLVSERGRALVMDNPAARTGKISHLTNLRTQLSVVNVARASAPHFLESPHLESAYDVIEEAYGTIAWNIPLGPNDAAIRPLPAQFGPSGLDFNAFTAAKPRGIASPPAP